MIQLYFVLLLLLPTVFALNDSISCSCDRKEIVSLNYSETVNSSLSVCQLMCPLESECMPTQYSFDQCADYSLINDEYCTCNGIHNYKNNTFILTFSGTRTTFCNICKEAEELHSMSVSKISIIITSIITLLLLFLIVFVCLVANICFNISNDSKISLLNKEISSSENNINVLKISLLDKKIYQVESSTNLKISSLKRSNDLNLSLLDRNIALLDVGISSLDREISLLNSKIQK